MRTALNEGPLPVQVELQQNRLNASTAQILHHQSSSFCTFTDSTSPLCVPDLYCVYGEIPVLKRFWCDIGLSFRDFLFLHVSEPERETCRCCGASTTFIVRAGS
jgi:hypothetical protein